MTDLIVHIGLPKAGSTTIQNKVLRNQEGFLGQLIDLQKKNDFAKQFRQIAPVGQRTTIKEEEAQDWTLRVQEYAKTKWPDIKRVILSHEGLSQRSLEDSQQKWPIGFIDFEEKAYNRNVISFLSYFSRYYWTMGNVKVLLVLRNQPEWLASLYVQFSKRLWGATQDDFEREVDKMMESGDDYIDWSKWVTELHYNFGEENVCVLLLEDMDKQLFWDRLSKFFKIDIEKSEKQKIGDKHLNKRRGAKNCWTIPSIQPIKYVKMKEHLRKRKYLYHATLGVTRIVTTFVDITRFDLKRDAKIEMHEDLRKRILQYCRPFNERLADQLGLDLKERGYLL